jgi:hypothetical protein
LQNIPAVMQAVGPATLRLPCCPASDMSVRKAKVLDLLRIDGCAAHASASISCAILNSQIDAMRNFQKKNVWCITCIVLITYYENLNLW